MEKSFKMVLPGPVQRLAATQELLGHDAPFLPSPWQRTSPIWRFLTTIVRRRESLPANLECPLRAAAQADERVADRLFLFRAEGDNADALDQRVRSRLHRDSMNNPGVDNP